MRPKQRILDDSQRAQSKTPDWDTTASLHERLTIEVLIDIRDFLERITSSLEAIQRREVK